MRHWTSMIITLGMMATFVVGVFWAHAEFSNPGIEQWERKPPKVHTDLAARINAACRQGYKVFDWTVGDEFQPGTPGTVKVTCSSIEPNKNGIFDSYYVAVAR